jgi:hypothetical protein
MVMGGVAGPPAGAVEHLAEYEVRVGAVAAIEDRAHRATSGVFEDAVGAVVLFRRRLRIEDLVGKRRGLRVRKMATSQAVTACRDAAVSASKCAVTGGFPKRSRRSASKVVPAMVRETCPSRSNHAVSRPGDVSNVPPAGRRNRPNAIPVSPVASSISVRAV